MEGKYVDVPLTKVFEELKDDMQGLSDHVSEARSKLYGKFESEGVAIGHMAGIPGSMYEGKPFKRPTNDDTNNKGNKNDKKDTKKDTTSNNETQKSNEVLLRESKKSSNGKAPKLDISKYDARADVLHGDIEAMKKFVHEINEMEGRKTSSEHLKDLLGILDLLDPDLMGNFKLFMKTSTEESIGAVEARLGKTAPKRIAITVNTGPKVSDNDKSAPEVYVHEVIHSYTMFAIELAKSGDKKARDIVRELESLQDRAYEVMKKDGTFDPEMMDYMFNSENSLDEFIAHALTNEKVRSILADTKVRKDLKAKGLLGTVKALFTTILELVSGKYSFETKDKNVLDATLGLTMRLAESNGFNTSIAKNEESLHSRAWTFLSRLDEDVAGRWLQTLSDKVFDKTPLGPVPDSLGGRAIWFSKALVKAVSVPEYRKQFSNIADSVGLGADGTIQSIMRDFFDQEQIEIEADHLSLKSDRIDGTRRLKIQATKESILGGFKEPLTESSDVALKRALLDTNIHVLFKNKRYTKKKLATMLEDKDELYSALGNAKHRLTQHVHSDDQNFVSNQSSGLGYYMATGKGHIAQNLNAVNIARRLLTGERKGKVDFAEVALIEEVAALTALLYTDDKYKTTAANLLRKEPDGVLNVVKTAESIKEESRKKIFKKSNTHMIDGYVKEIANDRITMEIAPASDRKKLLAKGFVKVKDLPDEKISGIESNQPMALYINNSFAVSEMNRGGVRLTKMGSKGTDLRSIYLSNDADPLRDQRYRTIKVALDTERAKLIKKMYEGELDVKEIDYGKLPVMNTYGDVTGYRYTMSKRDKEHFLKNDERASAVLGATRGSIYDKKATMKHNDRMLKLLMQDAKDNYDPDSNLGDNGRLYTLISEKSSKKYIRDLWKILPASFKEEAERNEWKGIPVRTDMLITYFGYRQLSIVDFPGMKFTPAVFRNVIKVAETFWMEFIKIAKSSILIKIPAVILGNIVSNIMYSIVTGTNPFEIIQMYLTSIRDTGAYLKDSKELAKLKEAKKAGNVLKAEINRISLLENRMKNNPLHELAESGVYQAIVEDVSPDEIESTNKLKELYNKKTKNLPKTFKTGLNWMFLTEETGFYKASAKVLLMSDLVARDVENRKYKKLEEDQLSGKRKMPLWWDQAEAYRKGETTIKPSRIPRGNDLRRFRAMSKQRRIDMILKGFINYNKLSGSKEEYLNKVGGVMFTKYAKRIQRVISSTSTQYPLKSLGSILGQGYIYDFESIQDQQALVRSWYNLGFNKEDSFPLMGPVGHVMNVLDITDPPLVKLFDSRNY